VISVEDRLEEIIETVVIKLGVVFSKTISTGLVLVKTIKIRDS
jgi:hypothetical protein